MAKEKVNKKFTHEAKMKVTNLNPKKVPDGILSPGFKYVECEFTFRDGKKEKDIVALHEQQIEAHK